VAKTSYITIDPELEAAFYRIAKPSDRFVFNRLVRADTLLSRKRKKGISQRSLLPQLAAIWAGFSGAQKAAWDSAAAQMFLSGWQLFVQDQTIRILNDMAGSATPSTLHQSWVGNLKIAAPASEIKIVQVHPRNYWISQKVVGKKGMYEPVLITEDIVLPLTISLNYFSDLAEVSSPSFAKFYARVWHSYQGVDLYEELLIPLDYSAGWQHAYATLSNVSGYIVAYDLYFWLKGLRGNLYFDNIVSWHSEQNWARDPYCKDISQSFTRAFYQIPKHWAPVTLPSGAEFDTIYKDF
jgi:hypothetical protein